MDYLNIISFIFTIAIGFLSYAHYSPDIDLEKYVDDFNLRWFTASMGSIIYYLSPIVEEVVYTESDLSLLNGKNSRKIYLSILGKIFDVTEGKKYYGVGGSYHGFAGRDASKAFITGDFTEQGLTDDISDLSINELGDLQEWVHKYEKDYIYIGKLIGRFYDESGNPTEFLKEIEEKMSRASSNKKMDEFYKNNYPPCNAEWTPETGSRVWCSNLSGGIKRDWIGFPRKFHQPGSGKSRCACVNFKDKEKKQGNFEVYENCKPDSISCYLTQH